MISQLGYKVLVTQVFPAGVEHLDSDPVFGATEPLVVNIEPARGDAPARLQRDFHLSIGETAFPQPPIP